MPPCARIVYRIPNLYTTVYQHIYWCRPAHVLYTVYQYIYIYPVSYTQYIDIPPYTDIYTGVYLRKYCIPFTVYRIPIYIPCTQFIFHRIPTYIPYTNIYTVYQYIYRTPNLYSTVYQYIYLTPNIYTTVYQHIYGSLPAAYKSHFTRKNCHLMFPFSSSNCSYGLFPGLAPPLRFVNMDLMPI